MLRHKRHKGLYVPGIAPAATVYSPEAPFPPISVQSRDQQAPRELEASAKQLQKAACTVNTVIRFGASSTHVIICSAIPEAVGLSAPSVHSPADSANHQVLLPAFLLDVEDICVQQHQSWRHPLLISCLLACCKLLCNSCLQALLAPELSFAAQT